jgi:thiamine-monophosphate kinase
MPTPGTRNVVTTDSLIEGIHFRLDWTSWHDLGHKSLAVNLSDIAAMGARPRLAVISLGLTGREPIDGLLDLYRGLGLLAARYGTIIAGGDIVSSPDRLGIHVTAIGESWPEAERRLLTRDNARPGDLLAVSGPLGLSAAGLNLLLAGEKDTALTAAHHRPEPRIDYGHALIAAGVRAAMDLSDGLWGDLAKICDRSGIAARVDEAALPVPADLKARFPDRWLDFATRGGEDYELLFVGEAAAIERLGRICAERELPQPVVIGEVLAGGSRIVLRRVDGSEERVAGGAYDHFGAGGEAAP